LSCTERERREIAKWIGTAKPLEGTYYRSVEHRYMNPNEVLSGTGAKKFGGRFAPKGMKAVYLSSSDEGASAEVLARKKRLGGDAQINLDKYPRVVFSVTVALSFALDWSKAPSTRLLAPLRRRCMIPDDLRQSMEIGQILHDAKIQGLIFPSAVCRGRNLVVYLNNCKPRSLRIDNEEGLMETITKIAIIAE
jgi:RES domain-containing protein